MKRIVIALLLILSILTLVSCNTKEEPSEPKNIRIIYADWAGTVALTYLTKVVLEDKMGYEVQVIRGEAKNIYNHLARGDYDFFMGAWLPNTHERYLYHYGYKISDIGKSYHGAQTGLAVPDYVDINSIEELEANKDKFENKITAIEDGAGVVNNTEEAKRVYGFSLNINSSTTKGMLEQLDSAIRTHKWIVITGWMPHWMFQRYNLKFLDDPKGIYGAVEDIHTIARKGFRKSNPRLTAYLRKLNLNETQMRELIDEIHYLPGNPEKAARAWASKNNDVVSSWIPKK